MLTILQDIFFIGSVLTGVFFILVAGAGIIRLPDFYIRMSAITKAGTMGVGFILLGISIHFNDLTIAIKSFVIVSFMLLTSPVAAHIISRAAYIQKVPFWERNLIDQLSDRIRDLKDAEREALLSPNDIDLKWRIIHLLASLPPSMGGGSQRLLKQAAEIRQIDQTEGHLAFARIYMKDRNFVLAEKEFLAAVESSPQRNRYLLELAKFYSATDRFEECFATLESITRSEPGFVPALFECGKMAAETGLHLSRGKECLRTILEGGNIEDAALMAETAFYLGEIFRLQKDRAQARIFYEKALTLRQDLAKALQGLKEL